MKYKDLLWGFIRGKVRGVYKSVFMKLPFFRKILRKQNVAGSSSEYCYNIWMQNLKFWSKINSTVPEVVVEIGPGNSLGVGLAALLSGSQKYYGLEKTQFWNNETNVRIFDELVEFFKSKKETLTINYSNSDNTNEKSYDFPEEILSQDHMNACLSDERLNEIRKELLTPEAPNNKYIHSIIPWESQDVIEKNSVDYIFSHTVLQHLDDLAFGYETMKLWLKPKGCLSHTIDLTCLNRVKTWNGHWTMSKTEWKIITGGISLINREPLSTHLSLLKSNDFNIIYKRLTTKENTLKTEDLSEDYKHLNEEDLTTSGLFYFAQLN